MAPIKKQMRGEFVSDSSRGQLLIVTAVVIAALILSLAVVFNTALFTEAQSTSATFSDTARGESLKDTQITNIAQTIETENKQMDGDAEQDVKIIIKNIDTQTSQRQAKYGAIVSVSHSSTTGGTRVEWEDSDAEFINNDGNATWKVTDGIGSIRAFSMNFSTLPSLSDPTVADLQDDSFGIAFNPEDTAENATRYIYTHDDTIHIRGVDDTKSITTSCSITDRTTTTVHLSTDTLTSRDEELPCRNLWPDFDVETVQFENGNTATGEFEYVRDDGDEGTATEIRTAAAVYSLQVTYEYTTDDVEYATTTRVAEGEP
jgi:hypothetical protein